VWARADSRDEALEAVAAKGSEIRWVIGTTAVQAVPVGAFSVWMDAAFERLDLQPLSREETAGLLSSTLRGLVDPGAVERLWRLKRGNVLYLQNIVEQEVGEGRLAQDRNQWRWIADPVVSSDLVELIEARIGALDSAVSDVVDVLTVAEPIGWTSLSRLVDPTAVEEAEIRGRVALGGGNDGLKVRLAHPLYGEARRSPIGRDQAATTRSGGNAARLRRTR